MNYVFFDTGNDAFFSRITDAFCLIFVQSIVGASQRNGSTPGFEQIQREFDAQRKIFSPLNCTVFPSISCCNKECAENRTVLTSCQLDRFEVSMTSAKHALLNEKKYVKDRRTRSNIQTLLESYQAINVQIMKVPIRKKHHNEYLRSYVMVTNELKDKAKGFVYVRSKTNSDCDYFLANTDLPNVIVCDNYQYI